jgi:hypothetical protein
MKTKFFILASIAAYVILAFGSSVRADSIYTFDSLPAGTLSGQDGWTQLNGTVTLVSSSSGGYYTEGSSSGVNNAFRRNDTNWSFTNTASTGTVTLLADIKGGSGNMTYGLAYSSNGTSLADTGPLLGFSNGSFNARASNGGTNYYAATSTLSGYTSGDWVQEKLVMTITSGGVITGTLYGRDITTGQTDWTTLISDISLGTDTNATQWNALYMRLDATGPMMDNLTVASVPEPSSAALLGLGFFSLLAYAWRKRKN